MHRPTLVASLVLAVGFSANGHAETINSTQLSHNIHMLSGKGGNVGLMTGPDGSFLIDDQFAPATEVILAKVKALGGERPKFVMNTHFHGDHTGGNENLGSGGSIIVSHDNVRTRLSNDTEIKAFNVALKALPKTGLPIVTFSQTMTLHLNNETIRIQHTPTAHTDGDSFVHFANSNVIHAGDLFFNGFFPFIDPDHGGSVAGVIAGVDRILALANDMTKIIPGHGPLATKADLQAYREMLATALERLSALKRQGLSAQQAAAKAPLADLAAKWGQGMFSTERWIEVIYDAV